MTTNVTPGLIWSGAHVVIAMVLRAVSGQGTTVSFVAVTTVVLGPFLVGWRMLWLPAARRFTARAAAPPTPR